MMTQENVFCGRDSEVTGLPDRLPLQASGLEAAALLIRLLCYQSKVGLIDGQVLVHVCFFQVCTDRTATSSSTCYCHLEPAPSHLTAGRAINTS